MTAPLPTTRRTVLTGTGAGLIVAFTAACSSSDDYAAPIEGLSVPETDPSAVGSVPDPEDPIDLSKEGETEAEKEEREAKEKKEGGGGTPLANLDDIPIGTAKAVKNADGDELIISHPGRGEVAAFSAICTHQGCPVKPVGKSLNCPCHGAKFDYATGEPTAGPAKKPLASFAIHMQGRQIMPGKKNA